MLGLVRKIIIKSIKRLWKYDKKLFTAYALMFSLKLPAFFLFRKLKKHWMYQAYKKKNPNESCNMLEQLYDLGDSYDAVLGIWATFMTIIFLSGIYIGYRMRRTLKRMFASGKDKAKYAAEAALERKRQAEELAAMMGENARAKTQAAKAKGVEVLSSAKDTGAKATTAIKDKGGKAVESTREAASTVASKVASTNTGKKATEGATTARAVATSRLSGLAARTPKIRLPSRKPKSS